MNLQQYQTAGQAITHYVMNHDRPTEQAAALANLFEIIDAKPKRPRSQCDFIYILATNTPAAKLHLSYFHIVAKLVYDAIAQHANQDAYKLALIALLNEMTEQLLSFMQLKTHLDNNKISAK